MGEIIGRWNYYFLRYGAGTVVGTVIVLFFANHYFCLNFDIKDFDGAKMVMLVALGFAYCYIATAPGLVFHATRGLFWKGNDDTTKNSSSSFLGVISLSVGISAILLLILLWFFRIEGYNIVWTMLYVFIIIFQWILIIKVFNKFLHIEKFYHYITSIRSSDLPKDQTSPVTEYVESYRDLREHGNAFESILLEIILLLTLCVFNANFILVLALWISPAVVCWIIGTRLEYKISKNE